MKILVFFILVFLSFGVSAQKIYVKTFGKESDNPIIFLHGGPGYNCSSFEVTSAQRLADNGYFVIVYDRRGEGRSKDPKAKFTFDESFDDLNNILKKYKLKKVSLIGHSFGGIVATLFAEKYPEKITSVFLVGAPIALQESFETIIAKCKTIYQEKNEVTNLQYITMLETMDSTTMQFSSYCFAHAMQNGFYSPKNPSGEAKLLYGKFKSDSTLLKYAAQMTYEGPQGFWKNEKYTTLDLTTNLKDLKEKGIPLFGLYGKEDGLYSAEQIGRLGEIIGVENVNYFNDCSHSVFVDQQSLFVEALNRWMK